MEETIEKVSKPKRLLGKTTTAKGMITISLSVICLLVFCCCGIFSKNQLDVGIKVSLSGFDLIRLAFLGGEYVENYWLDDGKGNGFYMDLTVTYPTFISWLAIIAVVLFLALIVVQVVRYTSKQNNVKLSKCVAYGSFILAAFFLVAYVYVMFCKTKTSSFEGKEVEFYRVFEVKVTMLLIGIFMLANGFIELKLKEETMPSVRRYLPVYGFMVVPLILILIFNFYPMLLQTVLSFKNYTLSDGVWGSEWVGFDHFKHIFTDPIMLKVIGRTIYISFLRLIVGIVPPLILSICLYDLKSSKSRSIFQNIVYIPHFFSWVVVYAICYSLLSPEGLLGSLSSGTDLMVSEKWFMPIVIFSSIWKELGWGTILYLAALSGVDTSLYEAAKIDGASPMQRTIHITLPSIKGTIIFLTVMSLGNILKGAGGEQLLLFYSATTKEQALVIDTWLVWDGITRPENYSLGAAISFFQSGIGMLMVLGFNKLSKKFFEVSIF